MLFVKKSLQRVINRSSCIQRLWNRCLFFKRFLFAACIYSMTIKSGTQQKRNYLQIAIKEIDVFFQTLFLFFNLNPKWKKTVFFALIWKQSCGVYLSMYFSVVLIFIYHNLAIFYVVCSLTAERRSCRIEKSPHELRIKCSLKKLFYEITKLYFISFFRIYFILLFSFFSSFFL